MPSPTPPPQVASARTVPLRAAGAWRRRVRTPVLLLALWAGAAATAAPPDSGPEGLRERLIQAGGGDPQVVSALKTFYRLHGYRPAWPDTARRQALLAALAGTADDGLDPEDYRLSALRDAWRIQNTASAGPEVPDETNLLATRGLLTGLAHLLNGKVDPRRLYPGWNFEVRRIDAEQSLREVSAAIDAGRIAELFDRARPPRPLYGRLRAGLHRLREIAARGGWPQIGPGPALKPGMLDERVARLRERLRVAGYLKSSEDADPNRYDAPLEAAVRKFQREQQLTEDGAVGAGTLAALEVDIAARIEQVRVNLERARWLLHETSREFLLVDIAGYRATYFKDGEAIWRTRVQVGRPYRKTPSFRGQIDRVTFNPTWTVPPGILRHDVLPKVRKDPTYLAANRIRAFDASGHSVPAGQVDWNNPKGLTLRQDAGPGNSLGRVAIRFDNPYNVYLHDTPHEELFDKDQRAFSSGCIRVENPLELVELLFADPAQWDRAGIDRAIAAGQTRNVKLPRPVTLLLAYWSVDAHAGGRVAFKRDIYGRDAAIARELALPQRLHVQ